jgi:hypothetical protein
LHELHHYATATEFPTFLLKNSQGKGGFHSFHHPVIRVTELHAIFPGEHFAQA